MIAALALILYPFRRRFFWRWYSLYLSSEYWHTFTRWRKFIHNRCEHCQRTGERHNPLQSHHLSYKILFREWLHPGMVQTLCKECHQKVTKG